MSSAGGRGRKRAASGKQVSSAPSGRRSTRGSRRVSGGEEDGESDGDGDGGAADGDGPADADADAPVAETAEAAAAPAAEVAAGAAEEVAAEMAAETVGEGGGEDDAASGSGSGGASGSAAAAASGGGGGGGGDAASGSSKSGAAGKQSGGSGSGGSSSGSSSSSSSSDDDSSGDEEGGGGGGGVHIAPITDSRTVTFDIAELNPHLTCRLCKGYFRDAHTVIECLHTFCKSCLFKEFSRSALGGGNGKAKECPHCKVALAANPRNSVIADRTLQEVVDKIFPGMGAADEAAEVAFYAARSIPLREQFRKRDNPDVKEEDVKEEGGAEGGRRANPKRPRKARDKDNGEAISFKLAPESGADTPKEMELLPLDKPFLRTSGKLKVVHLKKYLMKKLALKNVAEIEILCKGETLGQELSLLFISKSRWLDSGRDLVLNYRSCQDNDTTRGQ